MPDEAPRIMTPDEVAEWKAIVRRAYEAGFNVGLDIAYTPIENVSALREAYVTDYLRRLPTSQTGGKNEG